MESLGKYRFKKRLRYVECNNEMDMNDALNKSDGQEIPEDECFVFGDLLD